MKTAFHYILRAKLIRFIKDGEIDYIDVEEKFENVNPLIAREEAFKYYQNYIDVLLNGKNKKYTSDKQSRKELESFIDQGTTYSLLIGDKEIKLDDSRNHGIGIFMVVDIPIEGDKLGEEYIVHGIGNLGLADNPQSLMDGLSSEFKYYDYYKYNCKDHIQTIDFYEEGYETDSYNILITPFDWTGLDKPSMIDGDEYQESPGEVKTVEQWISGGESNLVEFKPSLLYNFKTQNPGIGVKNIIAKAICAFLNSNGGFLFIGVNDDGSIGGLNFDFQLSEDKNPKDFFQLEFDQMLEHFLSFSVKNNVVGQFYEIEGKDIFVVAVKPNMRRPIFLMGQNGKEFYVRGEASSRQLTDIEQIAYYCIDRWT